MTKGLEALYNPKQALNNIRYNYFESKREEDIDIEHFWFDTIEKELKALEIISKAYGDYANYKISKFELIMTLEKTLNEYQREH